MAHGKTPADDVLAGVAQGREKSRKEPQVKDKLAELEQQWGIAPAKMHEHLRTLGPKGAADFITHNTSLLAQFDVVRGGRLLNNGYYSGF